MNGYDVGKPVDGATLRAGCHNRPYLSFLISRFLCLLPLTIPRFPTSYSYHSCPNGTPPIRTIFKMIVASASRLTSDEDVNVRAISAANGPQHQMHNANERQLPVDVPSWDLDGDSDLGDEVEHEDGESRARPLSRQELLSRAIDKIELDKASEAQQKERQQNHHKHQQKGNSGDPKTAGRTAGKRRTSKTTGPDTLPTNKRVVVNNPD